MPSKPHGSSYLAIPPLVILPVESATPRSVTGRSGKSRLFSCLMATTALPSVSGI